MRLSGKEADEYQRKYGATRYYLMRMHCQNCGKIAGAVISKLANPKPALMKLHSAYLCGDCLNMIMGDIKSNNIPFNDANLDRFQESMK